MRQHSHGIHLSSSSLQNLNGDLLSSKKIRHTRQKKPCKAGEMMGEKNVGATFLAGTKDHGPHDTNNYLTPSPSTYQTSPHHQPCRAPDSQHHSSHAAHAAPSSLQTHPINARAALQPSTSAPFFAEDLEGVILYFISADNVESTIEVGMVVTFCIWSQKAQS